MSGRRLVHLVDDRAHVDIPQTDVLLEDAPDELIEAMQAPLVRRAPQSTIDECDVALDGDTAPLEVEVDAQVMLGVPQAEVGDLCGTNIATTITATSQPTRARTLAIRSERFAWRC